MKNKDNFISADAVLYNSTLGSGINIYKSAEVRSSKIDDNVVIGDYSIVNNSHLNKNVEINRRNHIEHSEIGNYSYTGMNSIIKYSKIGNFSSIAWNVSIGGANHDLYKVTTHAFLAFSKFDLGAVDSGWRSQTEEECIIGNDVWLAAGVCVCRNVKIGNGSVIAAGAVVTRDVEPYSIVSGIPGKQIKKRFNDKTIDTFEQIQWWNWPPHIIKYNYNLFNSEVNDDIIDKLICIKNNLISNKNADNDI